VEGRFSAIALGVGLAEKYMGEHAGRIPLILKLNGKTNIADDAEAVSPAFASVEDAVRLGADAVGYTVYVGSPRQDVEIREYGKVRQECERFGMPLVVWAYPRGRDIEAKGGKGTLYAQDYAARVSEELGADVVKLHEPTEDHGASPAPYRSRRDRAQGAQAHRGETAPAVQLHSWSPSSAGNGPGSRAPAASGPGPRRGREATCSGRT
jgi:class I fructose-bisphosphate aldolase